MSALTDASVTARKVALVIVGVIILYFVAKFLFGVIVALLTPPPPVKPGPPPPNTRFGKLPFPKFSIAEYTTQGMTFTLGNVDGKPPEATNAARVFSMPKKLLSFLAADRAKRFASRMGFNEPPQILSSTSYLYTDKFVPERTLTLDIVNMNYKMIVDFKKDPEKYFTSTRVFNEEQALGSVHGYIKGTNLFDTTIISGNVVGKLLRYIPESATFAAASSESTANSIRVDYFRKDMYGLKVVPPGYNESPTYALYTPSGSIYSSMLEIHYTFWPIAFDTMATYPLMSSAKAWEELQNGNGTVVRLGENTRDNVVIRNIFLAYYDSEEPQLYFQPIYVFEGDKGFVAYMPAIEPEWLADGISEETNQN